MKAVKTISDPEAFQLLADPTRRKIMFLLRVKEMTVSQISSDLGLTPQAVYHHIRKLQKAGIVEVAREERIGHLIESYYMATAESFNFKLGRTGGGAGRSRKLAVEKVRATLEALKKMGFGVRFDESHVQKLLELLGRIHDFPDLEKYEEVISEMDDLDFVTKLELQECVMIMTATDKEFAEQLDVQRGLRALLKSLVPKK